MCNKNQENHTQVSKCFILTHCINRLWWRLTHAPSVQFTAVTGEMLLLWVLQKWSEICHHLLTLREKAAISDDCSSPGLTFFSYTHISWITLTQSQSSLQDEPYWLQVSLSIRVFPANVNTSCSSLASNVSKTFSFVPSVTYPGLLPWGSSF